MIQFPQAHTRRSDFCGRLGGEEFLIIMTHATRENVEKVAERIRAELAMAPFTFSACDMISTASFGIAGSEAKKDILVSQCLSAKRTPPCMLPSERGAIASKARLRSRSEEDLLEFVHGRISEQPLGHPTARPSSRVVARTGRRSEGSACRSIRIE